MPGAPNQPGRSQPASSAKQAPRAASRSCSGDSRAGPLRAGRNLESWDSTPERNVSSVDWPTVLLSAGLIALLLVLRRFVPRVPGSLVVVAVAIALSELFDLAERGIAVVGTIQGGLPPVEVPTLAVTDVTDLLLPAAAFALIAFADTIATARAFAQSGHANLIDGESTNRR